MEFEFDKEMDALLRRTARGETVSAHPKSEISNPNSPHLDADEISLFAENSFNEKTKALYAAHFADCDRCRTILANVISLDSEIAAEASAAPQKTAVVPIVPWYKRLFAAPTLAYAMGAFLLVFGGLIGYTVLQNSNGSQNAEVAQVEPTPKMSGPNAGESAAMNATNQMAMSNGGSMQSNSSMSSAATTNSAMSNFSAASSPSVISPNTGAMSNAASVSNSTAVSSKQLGKEVETAKNEAPKPADSTASAARNNKTDSNASGANFAEQRLKPQDSETTRTANADEAIQAPAPKPAPPAAKRSAPAELPVNGRNSNDLKNARARKSNSVAAETRAVSGKTFRRENGAWYDADYNGQTTTNVSRNSSDFKKLDAGLRSIAANLSGAIVVVSNGRAYRIQ